MRRHAVAKWEIATKHGRGPLGNEAAASIQNILMQHGLFRPAVVMNFYDKFIIQMRTHHMFTINQQSTENRARKPTSLENVVNFFFVCSAPRMSPCASQIETLSILASASYAKTFMIRDLKMQMLNMQNVANEGMSGAETNHTRKWTSTVKSSKIGTFIYNP